MENSDLTLPIGNGFLNVRVGAIIMKDNQFLMAGNECSDYLYSVGGRVKFGESAKEAVVREVFEETGVKMEVDRLGFIHENFFLGDSPAKMGKLIHEISFFFYMKVPKDFTPICGSFTEDNRKEHLIWITADTDKKFYPEFFKTELKNPSYEIKHFVTNDKNKKGAKIMDRELINYVVEKTKELMGASSCSQEAKDAAQKWMDSVGTENEVNETEKYIKELEADVLLIDDIIKFAGSKEALSLFGEETAKKFFAHANEIKANGAKYCDCPACTAGLAILEKKEELLNA